MTSADLVRQACKERGVPLGRVEKELGFSNAYLKRMKRNLPITRVQAIAKYLCMPTEDLLPDDSLEKRLLFGPGDSLDRAVSDVKEKESRSEKIELQTTTEDLKKIVRDAIIENSVRSDDPEIAWAVKTMTDKPIMMELVRVCSSANNETLNRIMKYAELLMKGEL